MKKLIPCLAIVLAGCVYPHYAQPVTTTQPNNNGDYKVSYLFEYEGCKVYRFYDYGNNVYFTNCSGDTVAFADSTQVRSTGFFRNKPVSPSSISQVGNTEAVQGKRIDVSAFTRD
jgi:hypothetical protein